MNVSAMAKEEVLAELGVNYARNKSELPFSSVEEAVAFVLFSWPRDVCGALAELLCAMVDHAELINPEKVSSLLLERENKEGRLPYFVWGALCYKISETVGGRTWRSVSSRLLNEAKRQNFTATTEQYSPVAISLSGKDPVFLLFGISAVNQDLVTAKNHVRPIQWARENLPLFRQKIAELSAAELQKPF